LGGGGGRRTDAYSAPKRRPHVADMEIEVAGAAKLEIF
jgi:hypothetical protein